MPLTLGTFCSGIGSPDLAAQPLGWRHAFVSEINPHACSVLKHRFPNVPNLGDMTQINGVKYRGTVDLVVAGTPCQGFSLAGSRGGLADPRSALALKFVENLATIRPRWFIWENVPGVFSSNGGRDFTNFLGCLTGRSINNPSGRWKNSGIVEGIDSAYSVAWRTLGAQYFGVPQRRRRVFVVGYLGDWRPPANVLFESHCLQGHSAPRSKTWKADHARTSPGAATSVVARSLKSSKGNLEVSLALPCVIAFSSKDYGADATIDLSPTLRSGEFAESHANGGAPPAVLIDTVIRRLTPKECERLQGFPDDWTQVEHNGKPMPDGARYKMLGNTIAVPVISWIFDRINLMEISHGNL